VGADQRGFFRITIRDKNHPDTSLADAAYTAARQQKQLAM
jgi:hypothetical protein